MITIKDAVKSGKPYVYLLCYPNGNPFYVGKGINKRIYNHFWEAKKTEKNNHKLNTIRKILRQGQDVLLLIDSLHNSEQKALEREKLLQFEHGLKKKMTGGLTNVYIGGGKPLGIKQQHTSKYTYNKETKNLAKWSKKTNIPIDTLYHRLDRGWSVERALTQPHKRPIRNCIINMSKREHNNMDTTEQLRKYLKARLKQEGITQNQFAFKSGLSQGGLSMILQGKRGVTLKTLKQISAALCLETWELLKEMKNA